MSTLTHVSLTLTYVGLTLTYVGLEPIWSNAIKIKASNIR